MKIQLNIGEKRGRLTLIGEANTKKCSSGQYRRIVICKCDCGKVKEILLLHWVRNRTLSCGCNKAKSKMVFIGKKYGTITVVKDSETKKIYNKNYRYVIGECECGTVKEYKVDTLRNLKSCGCKTIEIIKEHTTIHNLTKSRIYKIWQHMKNRCYNKKIEAYKYYGQRGIIVCDEWLKSFINFKDWAFANGYEETLTIDRINVNGNYEPSNCRWATYKIQANNKTNTKKIFYNNEYLTKAEMADKYNLVYPRFAARVTKLKWDIEDAVKKEWQNPLKCLTNVDDKKAEELKHKMRKVD